MSGRIWVDRGVWIDPPHRHANAIIHELNHVEAHRCASCADRMDEFLLDEMSAYDAELKRKAPNVGRLRARWRNARAALVRARRMAYP